MLKRKSGGGGNKRIYLQNRSRVTNIENKLRVTRWEREEGLSWEMGTHIYIPLCMEWIAKALLYSTGVRSILCNGLYGRTVWKRVEIRMCVTDSQWCSGEESACQCRRRRSHGFNSWVGKISCNRKWQPTPLIFCLENSTGRRATVRGVTKSRAPRGN